MSLGNLVLRVFGDVLPKPQDIRVSSSWSARTLTDDQVRYANRDAFASLALYQALEPFPDVFAPIDDMRILSPELAVDIVSGSRCKRVARGRIVDAEVISSQLAETLRSSQRALVRVEELMAPGSTLPFWSPQNPTQSISILDIDLLPLDVVVDIRAVRHQRNLLQATPRSPANNDSCFFVLKDIWHWLDDLPVKKLHPLYPRFIADMRDARGAFDSRSRWRSSGP